MSLTVLNTDALMITEVRNLTGEPVARRMTDAEITRWINQAYDTILSRNLAYETVINQALATSDDDYPLSNVISVDSVIYTATAVATDELAAGAKGLLRMHPRHYIHLHTAAETTGPPQEYFFFGGELRIWPQPTAPQSTHYLKIFAHTRDATFSANDFANLKSYYHQYILWFAYGMALKKLGKYEQAFQYMSYFNNFIDFHKQNDLVKPVDSEDMMELPDRTQFVR